MYPAQWTILSYSLPAQNAAKGMSSPATSCIDYSKCPSNNLILLETKQLRGGRDTKGTVAQGRGFVTDAADVLLVAAVGGGRGVLAARLHAALRPVTRQAVHEDRALPRAKVTLVADAPEAIVFIDAQAAPGTATLH
jgi:hypothetical protein